MPIKGLNLPLPSRDVKTDRFPLFYAVLAGLAVAQIVATTQVYFSTLDLHTNVSALNRAGYLTIPSPESLEALKIIGPSVFGGLFFTLSIGAGLTLAAVAAAWFWHHLALRNRPMLIVLIIIWIAGVLMVNTNGVNFFGSGYFGLIPPAVFLVYLRCLPRHSAPQGVFYRLLPVFPLVCLAAIWGSQADTRLFVNIRDFLLLSNPVGQSVNDFYYRYTLYPAEAFKSLEQRLQHPIRLADVPPGELRRQIVSQLRSHDYLVVGSHEPVSLQIEQRENQLDWLNDNSHILSVSPESFISNPGKVLVQYSRQTDRSSFLRTATFFGILLGFPVLLYAGLYGLLRLLAGFILPPSVARLLAGILCFLLGVVLLVPVYQGNRRPVTVENLATALAATDWRDRVAALKLIDGHQLEITDYPSYDKSMNSRFLPERYWLTHALGSSKRERTIDDLLMLVEDTQPNVVCQALYALGRRGGDRKSEIIETILGKIRSTDNWYVQRYAYNALRSLGWRQPALN